MEASKSKYVYLLIKLNGGIYLYMFDVQSKNLRIFFVDNKRIANKAIFFDKKDAKKFCGEVKKYYFCNPISRGLAL